MWWGCSLSAEKEVWVETLSTGASTPHRGSGTRTLVHQGGDALFVDVATDTTISLGHFHQIEGLQLNAEQSMLLLEGKTFVFDEQPLKEFPTNSILPIPVVIIRGHRDSL